MTPGGADGPQQRRLSAALSADDRERVVDAEGGDQQGDAREHDQERAQELQEHLVDVVDVLLGELGACHRLNAVGQHSVDALDEVGLGYAVALDEDARHLPGARHEMALGGVEAEGGEGRPAEAVL